MMQFNVEVVRDETGEVVRLLGPMAERQAEKVADGLAINMNHEAYSVRIVEAGQ